MTAAIRAHRISEHLNVHCVSHSTPSGSFVIFSIFHRIFCCCLLDLDAHPCTSTFRTVLALPLSFSAFWLFHSSRRMFVICFLVIEKPNLNYHSLVWMERDDNNSKRRNEKKNDSTPNTKSQRQENHRTELWMNICLCRFLAFDTNLMIK